MTPSRLLAALLFSITALQAAEYVGSQACAGCHAAISRAYAQTPMGRASGPARAVPEGSFTRAGVDYRISSDGISPSLSYSKAAVHGRIPLDYVIGSGAHATGYLYRWKNMLFEAPISFYTTVHRWDVAPGYESETGIFLGRRVEPDCLSCHASGVQSVRNQPGRYEAVPFLEGAISCERCHGPGSAHIAGKGKMLNPVNLEPVRRDSVCAQCHLTGEVRVALPGRTLPDFQPGERLADSVVPFVWSAPDSATVKVVGHFEGLAASRCKQLTGDRLWCGTCHDPHSPPAPAERVSYFRAKCLTCHADSTCTAPAQQRRDAQDNCVGCHMPQKGAVDGLHTAFTDHRIQRGTQLPPAVERKLVPFWPGTASPREAALADADVAWKTHAPTDYTRALGNLTKALEQHPDDPDLAAQLGSFYDASGDTTRAERLYRRALRVHPGLLEASSNLGRILARSGRASEALPLWQKAFALDPGLEASGLNLARLYLQLGNPRAAGETLSTVLFFHPDSAAARELSSPAPENPTPRPQP